MRNFLEEIALRDKIIITFPLCVSQVRATKNKCQIFDNLSHLARQKDRQLDRQMDEQVDMNLVDRKIDRQRYL